MKKTNVKRYNNLKKWRKYNKEMTPKTPDYIIFFVTTIIYTISNDLKLEMTKKIADIIGSMLLGWFIAWFISNLIVESLIKKEIKLYKKEKENEQKKHT